MACTPHSHHSLHCLGFLELLHCLGFLGLLHCLGFFGLLAPLVAGVWLLLPLMIALGWALPPSILMVLPAYVANLAGQLFPLSPAIVRPTWLRVPPTSRVLTLQLGCAPIHLLVLPKTPAHERCRTSPPVPGT